MKRVYVAGPFRAPTAWGIEQNIREVELIGLEVARLGAAPLIPHSMYRFINGALSDEFWLAATLELMRGCDAVVLSPRWQGSAGSRGEVAEAARLMISCFGYEYSRDTVELGTPIGSWGRFSRWVEECK